MLILMHLLREMNLIRYAYKDWSTISVLFRFRRRLMLIEIQYRDIILFSCDRSKNTFLVFVSIDSSTYYPAFSQSSCIAKPLPQCLCAKQEAVCTIFIMISGMTRPGCEPAIVCMKDGRANHSDNPTRWDMLVSQILNISGDKEYCYSKVYFCSSFVIRIEQSKLFFKVLLTIQ